MTRVRAIAPPHPLAPCRTGLRTASRALVLVATIAAGGCSSPTDTGARRSSLDDSLLVERLSGTFTTADTVVLHWSANGSATSTRLETERGPLTILPGHQTTFDARGVRADTVTSDDPPYVLASLDSLPMAFWLHGDSLIGFWMPQSVPRTAVSDSGLHWVAADGAAPGCQFYLAFFVRSGATNVSCRMALHWRPMLTPGAP